MAWSHRGLQASGIRHLASLTPAVSLGKRKCLRGCCWISCWQRTMLRKYGHAQHGNFDVWTQMLNQHAAYKNLVYTGRMRRVMPKAWCSRFRTSRDYMSPQALSTAQSRPMPVLMRAILPCLVARIEALLRAPHVVGCRGCHNQREHRRAALVDLSFGFTRADVVFL